MLTPRIPRPAFINQSLLSRPLPALHPNVSPSRNPPYSKTIQSGIANLLCHPHLEAVLHLMNDDLFSAHFITRKLQEDKGFGTWLHGWLHAAEGDYSNAKCWYHDTPVSFLTQYFTPYPNNPELTAKLQSSHLLDSLSLCSGIDPAQIRADTEKANLCPEIAWTTAELTERIKLDADGSITLRVRRLRWGELVKIMEILEKEFGWEEVEGTSVYTKDGAEMRKKSLIASGEGWRKF